MRAKTPDVRTAAPDVVALAFTENGEKETLEVIMTDL